MKSKLKLPTADPRLDAATLYRVRQRQVLRVC